MRTLSKRSDLGNMEGNETPRFEHALVQRGFCWLLLDATGLGN